MSILCLLPKNRRQTPTRVSENERVNLALSHYMAALAKSNHNQHFFSLSYQPFSAENKRFYLKNSVLTGPDQLCKSLGELSLTQAINSCRQSISGVLVCQHDSFIEQYCDKQKLQYLHLKPAFPYSLFCHYFEIAENANKTATTATTQNSSNHIGSNTKQLPLIQLATEEEPFYWQFIAPNPKTREFIDTDTPTISVFVTHDYDFHRLVILIRRSVSRLAITNKSIHIALCCFDFKLARQLNRIARSLPKQLPKYQVETRIFRFHHLNLPIRAYLIKRSTWIITDAAGVAADAHLLGTRTQQLIFKEKHSSTPVANDGKQISSYQLIQHPEALRIWITQQLNQHNIIPNIQLSADELNNLLLAPKTSASNVLKTISYREKIITSEALLTENLVSRSQNKIQASKRKYRKLITSPAAFFKDSRHRSLQAIYTRLYNRSYVTRKKN